MGCSTSKHLYSWLTMTISDEDYTRIKSFSLRRLASTNNNPHDGLNRTKSIKTCTYMAGQDKTLFRMEALTI